MRKLTVIFVLLALAGIGWFGFRAASRSAAAPDSPLTSASVARRVIDAAVSAVGEINPANQVTVKPEVNGRIKTIPVTTGQAVPSGAPLLSLDDTDLLTERDSALTEIDSAKVQLSKAQRDFQRSQGLFASRLVSQELFDNARTTLDLASNDFVRAEKQLQGVDDKLKKIRILAPFNGTVLNILVSGGQVVAGPAGMNQGTDLMTFADLNQMLIRAHINQVDVIKLAPDQSVEITVDSLPGVTMQGRVTLIAPVATVKNNVKGFSIDVLITKNDPRARPGMNANLRFPVKHDEQALSVPLSAVFSEGSDKVVYVKTPTGSQRRVVKLGISDLQHVEIKEGVKEGETVLLEKPSP